MCLLVMAAMCGSLNATEVSTLADINPQLQAKLQGISYPQDMTGKPSRFSHVRKLLEISSGAKQVMKSDVPEAHNAYIEARKMYLSAAQETDNDKVNILLDKTIKLMYKAIQLASPKELLNRKKKQDFEHKRLSVNALLEALERIAIEKQEVAETDKLKEYIVELLASAEQLVNQDQLAAGQEELDEAYLLTKTGIENMRRGDVLVRELNFASIEEEYVYEIDRNDTHQMLIKLLVAKKLASKPEAFKDKINNLVLEAKTIRTQAESLAIDNDFKGAIVELERSTKQLVRAIRMGGVFIPG
jgi:hypothetical protein